MLSQQKVTFPTELPLDRFARPGSSTPHRLRSLTTTMTTESSLSRVDSTAVLVRSAEPVDRLPEEENAEEDKEEEEEEEELYTTPVEEEEGDNDDDDGDNNDDDGGFEVAEEESVIGGGGGDGVATNEARNESVIAPNNSDVGVCDGPFAGYPSLEADRDAPTVVIQMDTSTSVI